MFLVSWNHQSRWNLGYRHCSRIRSSIWKNLFAFSSIMAMSILEEIKSIRQQMLSLSQRLQALESTVLKSPSNQQEDIQSQKTVCNASLKTKHHQVSGPSPCPVPKLDSGSRRDPQTLRSRAFKVMRNLINTVDVSHTNHVPPTRPKKYSSRKTPSGSVPSHAQLSLQSARTVQSTDQQEACESLLRTRIKPRVASHISNCTTISKHTSLHKLIKNDYQGLCFPTDESLATDYCLSESRWVTTANQVQRRANKAIKRQLAGVWRWDPETTAAVYMILKKQTPASTMYSPFWQFSGWSTHDTPESAPPSTSKLPQIVLDGLVKPTWFWHQDRWLLFSLNSGRTK